MAKTKRRSKSKMQSCPICQAGPLGDLHSVLIHMKSTPRCKGGIIKCVHCKRFETPFIANLKKHHDQNEFCRNLQYQLKNPDVVQLPVPVPTNSSITTSSNTHSKSSSFLSHNAQQTTTFLPNNKRQKTIQRTERFISQIG